MYVQGTVVPEFLPAPTSTGTHMSIVINKRAQRALERSPESEDF